MIRRNRNYWTLANRKRDIKRFENCWNILTHRGSRITVEKNLAEAHFIFLAATQPIGDIQGDEGVVKAFLVSRRFTAGILATKKDSGLTFRYDRCTPSNFQPAPLCRLILPNGCITIHAKKIALGPSIIAILIPTRE